MRDAFKVPKKGQLSTPGSVQQVTPVKGRDISWEMFQALWDGGEPRPPHSWISLQTVIKTFFPKKNFSFDEECFFFFFDDVQMMA